MSKLRDLVKAVSSKRQGNSLSSKPRITLPDRDNSISKEYLSVVAIFKNEARYLTEWLEFHRLVGVEHIYLYDHGSSDHPEKVFAEHIKEGFVTVTPWPFPYRVDRMKAQTLAYAHALMTFGANWRWMAFIDIDEFLFPSEDDSLLTALSRYEDLPAIVVFWALFGFSGHHTPPPGLVIENYTMRARDLSKPKSIVDPRAVRSISNVHLFDFDLGDQMGFDENREVFPGRDDMFRRTNNVLRLNHYYTRSAQEFEQKKSQKKVNRPGSTVAEKHATTAEDNPIHDDAILRFLPELKRRLATDTR